MKKEERTWEGENRMTRRGRKLMKVVAVEEEEAMGNVLSVDYRVIVSLSAQRKMGNVLSV
ncbi:hypothetical protein A2U01_0097674, partial [Trifolium medium]|nr:hypothetical protein [Trifolium medium]